MTRQSGSTGRSRIGSQLPAFVRLARPHFLAGGFVLYGLGAAIARYEGARLDATLYAVGQVFVTGVQLMTHFLNEYWDVETDRLNSNRTFFSGGSGVLSDERLDRSTAWRAALVCLAMAGASGLALVAVFPTTPPVWSVMLLAIAGGWFYSSPPIRLAASGWGELATALLVAFLLPAFSHLLQAATLPDILFRATAPLVAINFAMLLAFDLPDLAADRSTGKRTLLVRLGLRRGRNVHTFALIAAYGMIALFAIASLPPTVALAGSLTWPLALIQIWQMRRAAKGGPAFGWLTFGAVSLFAITAALITFGFWKLG